MAEQVAILPPAVELEGVCFNWPGQEQLLNIPKFSVQSGEHVFISGPSGTGKSTLLNLIAGIIVPVQGEINVLGTKLAGMSKAKLDLFRGDHIGFIFQQFNLIPYLSVVENVLLPVRLSKKRAENCAETGKSAAHIAHTLLKELELPCALWDYPVHRLSVGQQQRVAAARALLGAPEILIADEPTSSLDEDRKQMFLALLLAQCTKAHSTLLFVSHDQTLASLFTRVVKLETVNRAGKGAEA